MDEVFFADDTGLISRNKEVARLFFQEIQIQRDEIWIGVKHGQV